MCVCVYEREEEEEQNGRYDLRGGNTSCERFRRSRWQPYTVQRQLLIVSASLTCVSDNKIAWVQSKTLPVSYLLTKHKCGCMYECVCAWLVRKEGGRRHQKQLWGDVLIAFITQRRGEWTVIHVTTGFSTDKTQFTGFTHCQTNKPNEVEQISWA